MDWDRIDSNWKQYEGKKKYLSFDGVQADALRDEDGNAAANPADRQREKWGMKAPRHDVCEGREF